MGLRDWCAAETKCLRGWTCATSARMRIRVSGYSSFLPGERVILPGNCDQSYPADTAGAPHPLSIKGIFRSRPVCTFPVLPYNLPPTLPVLLCIWLIGVIRQKPDKEVRDTRLNESRPGALCLTRSSDENPNDLPPHHPAPASCGRESKKGQLTMTAHNDLVQNLYDDCSPTTTCSPAAPIARDRRPARRRVNLRFRD